MKDMVRLETMVRETQESLEASQNERDEAL